MVSCIPRSIFLSIWSHVYILHDTISIGQASNILNLIAICFKRRKDVIFNLCLLYMLITCLQPSWRHLQESDKYSMIAYRLSDMRQRAENDMGWVGALVLYKKDKYIYTFRPSKWVIIFISFYSYIMHQIWWDQRSFLYQLYITFTFIIKGFPFEK